MKKDSDKPDHSSHSCRSIVVSCMDFRLRKSIGAYIKSHKIKDQGFDRVAVAGGVKNLAFVLDQVSLSHKLHHIDQVYLINHEDCGAYGEEGTFKKHKEDLLFAKEMITHKFKSLKVILLYLKLNGEFISIK